MAEVYLQYTTIFEAGVNSIKACAIQNLYREYKNRNSYIILENQAELTLLAVLTRSTQNSCGTAINP
jgi:hypothetical protein